MNTKENKMNARADGGGAGPTGRFDDKMIEPPDIYPHVPEQYDFIGMTVEEIEGI